MKPEHSAAMTLGMLSGGMTPNTAAAFNTVQSPGGTNYPTLGLSLPTADGLTGLTPDFQPDTLGMANSGSPFSSMFGNMGEMDLTQNFDWVRIL